MIIRNYLFHRVSDEKDAMWPPMTTAVFGRIIRQLTRNYSIVPFEAYMNDTRAFSGSKNITTIMFDDGYKDNIEFAAPILLRYRCPASFYVVSDCIDKNIPTWTYIVDYAVSQTKKNQLELTYEFVPSSLRRIELRMNNNPAGRVKAIKPWMKKISNQQRQLVLRSILEQCSDIELPHTMMNWDDLR